MTGRRVLIPHLDDLGVTHGATVAMEELAAVGLVTSGSVMVPAPWFPEVAELARRRPDLDLGVHLTLTSESAAVKWRPLSTRSPGSGLVDENGYFWRRVQSVRDHADPKAVERELRAQIELALTAGIAVTHVDHHMGASLFPEFAEITTGLGREFGVPVLFPREIASYFDVLGKGAADIGVMERIRDDLERTGAVLVDRFVMGLEMRDQPAAAVYRRLLGEVGPGVSFVALHCNAPGDIEWVHPKDHGRRTEEYELFADPAFAHWVRSQGFELRGVRDLV